MGASAGIDGAYMAKLMPPVLGYTLNAVSDISSEVLIFWYARLRQYPKNTKRYRMAWALLVGEVLLTFFAWLFGWRQLLPIVTMLEGPRAARWLAPVFAAFTPTLLITAGYAQALLAGRIEREKITEDTQVVTEDTEAAQVVTEQSVTFSDNGKGKVYRICEFCGFVAQSPQAWAGHCKGAQYKQNAAEALPVLTEHSSHSIMSLSD